MANDITDSSLSDFNSIEEFHYLRRYEDDLFNNLYNNRVPIDDPLVTGYNFIFITTPNIAIQEGHYSSIKLSNNVSPIEKYYNNTARHLCLPISGKTDINLLYDPRIIQLLGGKGSNNRFMNPLTNLAVKYTATDTKLDTLDYAETWDKHKIVIGTSDKDSKMAGTIQVEYMENNNLLILKTHNLWKNYIDKCFSGDIITPQALQNISTSRNTNFNTGHIDYASSMYHFSTLPDGETLTYWAKYTGLFPLNVPWSLFTSDDSSINIPESVPIEYQYSYKEEMNLYILRDFNTVSYGTPKFFDPTDLSYFEGSSVNINVPGNNSTYQRIMPRPKPATGKNMRVNAYTLKFGPSESPVTPTNSPIKPKGTN